MKRCILFLSIALLLTLGHCISRAAADSDIPVSAAVKPDDTAQYQILVTTMGGISAMQSARVLHLDARGIPAAEPSQKAWHVLPEGMRMGKYLPLVRPERYTAPTNESAEANAERADWAMKIYWGSAKEIPKGQPLTISTKDTLSGAGKSAALFSLGSGVSKGEPGKGWGWGIWPNAESSVPVPAGASLKGAHFLHGNYLPHIEFSVRNHDFLDALDVDTGDGDLESSIHVKWQKVPGAIGYFVYATAASEVKREMAVWTSSSKATLGMGTHEHSLRVRELEDEGITLEPDVLSVDIPSKIFKGYEMPIVMVFAWGEDYWASYPPKPQNPPKGWKPDWTVNALFLSSWMGSPGLQIPAAAFPMPGSGTKDTDGSESDENQSPNIKIDIPVRIPTWF